jgi:hypothetical protein
MHVMAKLSYENQIAIRSTGKVIQALDNLVAAMRGSGKVRFRGRTVTKEAVVNAVWLWLADLEPDQVEAALSIYVPRFEAMIDNSSSTEVAPSLPTELDPGALYPVAIRDETAMHERQYREAQKPKKAPKKKPSSPKK